ncbi:hypothetical protein BDQ17DRAFT_1250873, partial [Cyathus striatus]
IDDVTRHAFTHLGEEGIIRSAENHYCSECAQRYRANADIITPDDPAAVAQVDENQNIPALTEFSTCKYGCAIENCTQDLVNARQGVFCAMHEVLHKNLCRVNGCNKNLV